jgi:Rhodopirellula transposase DDE domain
VRLWKIELINSRTNSGFHHRVPPPPGTSKWNKIEHRLFSFITGRWRGKPLFLLLMAAHIY